MARPQKAQLTEPADPQSSVAPEGAQGIADESTERCAETELPEGDLAEFQATIEIALTDCYPELLKRLKSAKFSDWHRQCRTHVDLAHSAMLSVLKHVLKARALPSNLLAYLVTTAENLAKKDWLGRETDPLAKTASDPSIIKSDKEKSREDTEPSSSDQRTGFSPLMPLREFSTLAGEQTDEVPQAPLLDQMRMLIEKLPKRQRQVLKIYLESGTYQTYREMAEVLGISEDNFQHALERAGRSICKLLKTQGFDAPVKINWRTVGLKAPISMKEIKNDG